MSDDDRHKKAVDLIIADLRDRRGFRQVWDELDDEVKGEIRTAWVQIMRKML